MDKVKVNVDIEKFLKKFNQEYSFLYEHKDNVAGFREAVEYGDMFISKNPEFVGEFVNYRGDFISSDREVAAFMFAMESFGGL